MFPGTSPQNHFAPWGEVPNCMGRCGGACGAMWSTAFTALGGVNCRDNCREVLGAMWPMFTTHGPHVATTIPGQLPGAVRAHVDHMKINFQMRNVISALSSNLKLSRIGELTTRYSYL